MKNKAFLTNALLAMAMTEQNPFSNVIPLEIKPSVDFGLQYVGATREGKRKVNNKSKQSTRKRSKLGRKTKQRNRK